MDVIRKIFIAVFAFISCFSASAQSNRHEGLNWNAGIINQGLLLGGAEAAIGYMPDTFSFFGVGGAFLFGLPNAIPNSDYEIIPGATKLYLDWHSFIKDSCSSPVIGAKVGYCKTWDKYLQWYKHNLMIELNLGWTWETKKGKGISVMTGLPLPFPNEGFEIGMYYKSLPTISMVFSY